MLLKILWPYTFVRIFSKHNNTTQKINITPLNNLSSRTVIILRRYTIHTIRVETRRFLEPSLCLYIHPDGTVRIRQSCMGAINRINHNECSRVVPSDANSGDAPIVESIQTTSRTRRSASMIAKYGRQTIVTRSQSAAES